MATAALSNSDALPACDVSTSPASSPSDQKALPGYQHLVALARLSGRQAAAEAILAGRTARIDA